MDFLQVRRPDDFHLHVRQGELLRAVVPHTANDFARALIMPNTTPPIADADAVRRYRDEINRASGKFEPLMTIKVTPETSPGTVRAARVAGAIAGKLYPEGVTTNSADGVRDFRQLSPTFAAMADEGMVLCVHGEDPDAFCLDREAVFLDRTLNQIVTDAPDLRVVLEHISTAAAVDWIRNKQTGVGATITVHHLLLTLDDVVGDLLKPHHFCKPLAKRPEDRLALIDAATSGDERFFLGTDSAPHPRNAKEHASGCAGVFTAPIALGTLAQVFAEVGMTDRLEAFTSVNGARFYGLPLNDGSVTLVNEEWRVPAEYDDIVPLLAQRTVGWKVLGDTAINS